jgi:hypothetical protein
MGGHAEVTFPAGLWCRRCHLPAEVQGDPEWGTAVHAGTGSETCADGRVCAPVDFETAEMRAARGRMACAALGFP